jgi:hypothetical protein
MKHSSQGYLERPAIAFRSGGEHAVPETYRWR